MAFLLPLPASHRQTKNCFDGVPEKLGSIASTLSSNSPFTHCACLFLCVYSYQAFVFPRCRLNQGVGAFRFRVPLPCRVVGFVPPRWWWLTPKPLIKPPVSKRLCLRCGSLSFRLPLPVTVCSIFISRCLPIGFRLPEGRLLRFLTFKDR